MRRWLLAALLWAAAASPVRAEPPDIVVFTREGCPHCEAARDFLDELRRERPELRVVERDVARDPAALAELVARAEEQGASGIGVPTFLVRGRLVVGFGSADTTGRQLRAALAGAEETLELPLLGPLDPDALALPLLTLVLGLLDGFNPCAMWVLIFLLSLLAGLRDRRRMVLVAGTFVLVSGVTYFLFMLAWLSAFRAIGASRGVELVLGAVAVAIGALHLKEAAAPGAGPSLVIPEAAKPSLYRRMRAVLRAERPLAALAGAFALAVLANLVELGCTAGLPAVYTRILSLRELPDWQFVAYLGLYNVAYVADDALMVAIAVATLSRRRLQERAGRWLQLVSGGVMIALGVLLWAAPRWLR